MPNWSRYPYPFIDGKCDSTLFPLTEWREASRLSLSVADVVDWSTGSGDADDPMLLEEIRTRILTRRGIHARPDQILITMGTRNSLYLISQLLADNKTVVAMEEPGNFIMRELLETNGATVMPQPIDEQGVVVDEALATADVAYVTPSHQISTRFGRLLPIAAAILVTACATWLLHYSSVNPDSWVSSVFWLAQAAIGIMWAFVISYLLGMNAEFDTTGQMAALGGFASKMGLASGPAVAALIVGESNYGLIITVATVALVLALIVVIIPARILDSGG